MPAHFLFPLASTCTIISCSSSVWGPRRARDSLAAVFFSHKPVLVPLPGALLSFKWAQSELAQALPQVNTAHISFPTQMFTKLRLLQARVQPAGAALYKTHPGNWPPTLTV